MIAYMFRRRRQSPHPSLGNVRHQSTPSQFYHNKQLELYASKEAKPLTLRQLVFFGRSMNEDRLFKSANYVRTELPVRIAHRLRDLQALPYVVVTQEGVAKVYELYWSAFEKFRNYPPVTTLKENEDFCNFLSVLLDEHASVIPNLSLGLSLSSPYLPPEKLDAFMRRMLISRISRRVLAEHHIALSEMYGGLKNEEPEEPHVGIIFTGLKVKRSIEKCVKLLTERPMWLEVGGRAAMDVHWPQVKIDGHLDAKFAYIREHFEYIAFQLLKNSMRSTVLKHQGVPVLPSIQVTIVAGENDIGLRISDQGGGLSSFQNEISNPSDLFSFSHIRNATRLEDSRLGALRMASEHGLRATVDEQVSHWQQLVPSKGQAVGREENSEPKDLPQPRIGIGLPMSYIFATYFGGSLELVSLDGWGTDVYLRLPKLGTNLEGIEV